MIVLESLFPVLVLLVAGRLLHHWKVTDDAFLRVADRLIYVFFFPVMLFWKIGSASFTGIDVRFCLASLFALVIVFLLSSLFIRLLPVAGGKACSFSQACYRFNTYIGMAVILNALGSEGVQYFGILIAFAIPLLNTFAVTTLLYHSGREIKGRKRGLLLGKALLSNPLILGCLAGLVFSRYGAGFPTFIDNSLRLISMVSLPLALISIGGSLRFAGVRANLGLAMLSSLFKLVVLPLTGGALLYWFGVTGIPFKVGLIFFALPTSTAIYVLSSQLGSDTELASAEIVLSTLLSFVSLSVVLLL